MLLALLLIFCVALAILGLGLPLLLKPDSPIPFLIEVSIMTAAVLAFVWATGTYWIILPILAVVALVARLDRTDRQPPEARRAEERAIRDRTRLLFRLWCAANLLLLALLAGVPILPAAGFGWAVTELVVPGILFAMVAIIGFRNGFHRSCRRDQCAPAEEAMPA